MSPTVGTRTCSTRRRIGTLFCGDLFTQLGDGPALSTGDVLEGAAQAEDIFGSTCLTPNTAPTIRRLAELEPTTLAIMHGSSYNGDGTKALLALADDYDNRLANVAPLVGAGDVLSSSSSLFCPPRACAKASPTDVTEEAVLIMLNW